MFKVLAEKTGIANFSYVNVDSVYDITRELDNNMTDKQPPWVFQTWAQYENSSTLDIISELRRVRFMTNFDSPDKAKVK
ncbi:unnamed protein product [Cylicostephanus goldi]|uniref:Uncharacterized protein n=1 Tax=Cylicostephanus goldi TaxID=71465 RepID=A0A3P7MZ63_CYLGO|nr:unnamed protein product [Cylicostephanus goldi]